MLRYLFFFFALAHVFEARLLELCVGTRDRTRTVLVAWLLDARRVCRCSPTGLPCESPSRLAERKMLLFMVAHRLFQPMGGDRVQDIASSKGRFIFSSKNNHPCRKPIEQVHVCGKLALR